MTGRFYKGQIGSIYLSKTGADAEPYCKIRVAGFENLLATSVGLEELNASREDIAYQNWTFVAGKEFEIEIERLETSVYESIQNTDQRFAIKRNGIKCDFHGCGW